MKTVPSESSTAKSGSLNLGEPVYIAIAKIGKPHGLEGDFFVHLLTDFPERMRPGREVYLGEERQIAVVKTVQPHKKGFILRLENYEDINLVEKIKNKYVYVTVESLPPLPEGEYYHHQLLGLSVFDESEHYLGVLTEILETGANDVYVIKNDTGEELIPALKQNLVKIDIQNRKMVVKTLNYYN